MSLTNQQAINQALTAIDLIDAGGTPSSSDSSTALTLLNQMMAEWAVMDKDMHFPPQDTLTDTFPVPTWAENGVITNLAVRCAYEFKTPISQSLIAAAESGLNTISNVLMNLKLKKADMSHLVTNQGSKYNILTDLFN